MRIRDLLPEEHVFVPLEGPTLREALARMVFALAELGAVADSEPVLARIRGETMREVVALSSRVVLPHYRTTEVDRVVVALGIASDPLNAREAGLDARPRLVVLVLAPPEAASLYLKVLSSLARILRQDDVTDRLLQQTSAHGVLAVHELGDRDIQATLAVRDVMMGGVHPIPPHTPVKEAVQILLRRRVRAVPVVGEKGEVLGLVSERDIMRALMPVPRANSTVEADQPPPADLRVRDIMTRSVLCVPEDLALAEAATMMVNKDIGVLPVVADGALVGIITRGEIIRKLFGP